jgi:pyruvate kinase
LAFSKDPEKTLASGMAVLVEHEGFKSGDKIVVISDVIAGLGIDAIQIRRIP